MIRTADSAIAADDAAFVEKHADTVYKLALSRTKNPHSAADVFQDVFYRYFRKRPCFASEEHEKAWMVRVTINCSKSFLGSFWNKHTAPLSEALPAAQQENSGIYDEVMRLPLKYRTAIYLFYYEGFSLAEIAASMNLKENTVKSHLFRARNLLKERLTDYEV